MHLSFDGFAIAVDHPNAVAPNLGQVALLEIDEPLGHGQQRRHTAGDEVFAVAEADHERARHSRHDDAVRVFGIDDQQRVRALETLHRLADGLDEVHALLDEIMDEVCGDLGVGLRIEHVALGQHLVLDRLEVLDDAVVDDGDAAARDVRMRIRLGDAAVRRPARMSNADVAV